ncbi:UDP-N-acetylmuramoyl-L-alanyl-D-glutamate--2,6-diaminopimelate ligase [Spirochaetota bacterium]
MNLNDIIDGCKGIVKPLHVAGSVISSVEYDSRNVKEGSLFVAITGFESDGHDYLDDCMDRGAVAVVVSSDRGAEFSHLYEKGISVLASDNTRRALSVISSVFYGLPSKSMLVIGITGTNGKTSITYMLESVLKYQGLEPGIIGTISYKWADKEIAAKNTTPESKDIQEFMSTMRNDGVNVIIMEVSSHALDLFRVDDVEFDIAVFTNLTRDHLDYHKNFDEYFKAKKRIFDLLENSTKEKRFGIVNIDDDYGKQILNARDHYGFAMLSFGLGKEASYRPVPDSIDNSIGGLSYILEKPINEIGIGLSVAGTFHVYNSLAAIAVLHAVDIPIEIIQKGLKSLERVPGRFDVVKSSLGFSIIVDYAHTSDALLKFLQSVNEIIHSRIICVFGCGGDRDKTKRPIMGKIAVENSDMAIITSDNPRSEDPAGIIDDIVSGIEGKNYEIIPDREEAIKRAISMGEDGDIIVIAGKGHEDYQILETGKIHFDDREVAEKYILERSA